MNLDEQLHVADKEMEAHVKECDVCRDSLDDFCPWGKRKITEINEIEVELFNDARDREAEENGYGK